MTNSTRSNGRHSGRRFKDRFVEGYTLDEGTYQHRPNGNAFDAIEEETITETASPWPIVGETQIPSPPAPLAATEEWYGLGGYFIAYRSHLSRRKDLGHLDYWTRNVDRMIIEHGNDAAETKPL